MAGALAANTSAGDARLNVAPSQGTNTAFHIFTLTNLGEYSAQEMTVLSAAVDICAYPHGCRAGDIPIEDGVQWEGRLRPG
jgi:hypothetical protein